MPKPARTEFQSHGNLHARPWARVWDPLVRLFHWSLVGSFVMAWFTSHSSETMHYWAGFAAAGLIALRLVWGFLGTRYARFAQFVRRPQTILQYLTAIASGREARYVGHNPAGGAMVLALMAAMFGTALSGYLMTTDQFWGVTWVGKLHNLAAHGLLVLVLVHIGGVILASVRHRENLVRAMITGCKRPPERGDVD